MKKRNTIIQVGLFLMLSQALMAQTTHNFSVGASYANAQYYNLATDVKTNTLHSSWDIAFSVYGTTDAAVFVNEGSSSSGVSTKLYTIPNKIFSDNILVSDLGTELKNDEKSWENGAFNSIKSLSNWADYGWGSYNLSNHKIIGTALYAVELPNGSYKKLMIDTLSSGIYQFRYADLDGSNLEQKSIAKSAFPNQTLAYFSFATNNTMTVEPSTGWDWLFTRYETVLDNAGTPIPYAVAGILTNKGVEAVLADGINPATVDIANYNTTADSLTIIGHTWKTYDFTNGWMVDADRVYFIKTADSTLYKIQFIDFQGSSSGQGTFIKTVLGKWTAIEQLDKNTVLESFNCFPNPTSNELNIAFSLEKDQENMQFQVVNMLGQVVFQQIIKGNSGLNATTLPLEGFPMGNYTLILQSEELFISKKIIKN